MNVLERLGRGFFWIVLGVAGCPGSPAAPQVPTPVRIEQHFVTPSGPFAAAVAAAYERHGHAPLWFDHGRPTRAASELRQEVANAGTRGLVPTDYGLQKVDLAPAAATPLAPEELARADMALSVAAARLASELHSGRIPPSEVGYDLDVRPAPFDVTSALLLLARSRDVASTLDGFEPRLRHFALLKHALARYRRLAAAEPDLTSLPALPLRKMELGAVYAGAPALRRLLVALGDLPPAAESSSLFIDASLVEGLRRFQARHGLDVDGVLGRATFDALTTPLDHRVRQIELTMERIRWLPAFETPPIIVNVPQFRLFAFRTVDDAADEILQMDVIVGSAFKGRRTPVFSASMRSVVIRPYWDVPRSILVKELLPDIRANPRWITANDYEIVRGDGDDSPVLPATVDNVRLLERGQARLRQKPGPTNALGRVKFMFPNRHNVYLHDTPARALFQRSRRAFSHGCIRVADPMALLDHVMRQQTGWSDLQRDAALARSSPTRIPLQQPIRVFILYGTALAKEDGTVLFFDDLYGLDEPLGQKLTTRSARGGIL